jgi:hypothetical protein
MPGMKIPKLKRHSSTLKRLTVQGGSRFVAEKLQNNVSALESYHRMVGSLIADLLS